MKDEILKVLAKIEDFSNFVKWKIYGRNEFSISDIMSLLLSKKSIIVHCASYSTFVGSKTTQGYSPLEKLTKAANSNYDLSCSVINLNEGFHTTSCTGPMGLILFPKNPDSILMVNHSDSGTMIDESRFGRRYIRLRSIRLPHLRASISMRTDYHNEWNLNDYIVIGVAFLGGDSIFKISGNIEKIPHNVIDHTFPESEFYFIGCGEVVQLEYSTQTMQFEKIGTKSLYELYHDCINKFRDSIHFA